jgi:hypothetical protein
MKDVLLRVIGNSAVRKALIALVLAVAAAAGLSFGTGCGGSNLPPEVAEAKAEFECRLAALKSVVSRDQAEGLLRSVNDPQALAAQLLGLGLTPDTVNGACKAFKACAAPADAGAE